MAFALLFLAPVTVLGSTFWEIGSFDDHTFFIPAPAIEPDGTAEKCADETNSQCNSIWWRERIPGAWRGEITSTWGPDTRLQLTFLGSGITIAGITDADGAHALGSIDGGPPTAASFASADGKRHFNVTVFEAGGLDGAKRHVLNLWFDRSAFGGAGERRYMRINTFEAESPDSTDDAFPRADEVPFTPPTSASSTAPPSPSATNPTSTHSGSTPGQVSSTAPPEASNSTPGAHLKSQHGLQIGGKIAIAVSITLSICILAVLALLWRRIRRRTQPFSPSTSSAPVAETIRIGQHPGDAPPAKQRALRMLSPPALSESSAKSTSAGARDSQSAGSASDVVPATGNSQLAALHATMDQVGISAASLRAFLERLPRSDADRGPGDAPPPGYDRG